MIRPVTLLLLAACVAVTGFVNTASMSRTGKQSCACEPMTRTTQRSELGERQRFVERKMLELEDKFIVIAQKLQEKEPERAQRLIAAYQQAKEKLIVKEMAAVSALLDEQKLTEADEKLNLVIENLSELFRLLMNEKTETASKKKEIENLEKWKQAIQSLQKEQNQQTRETDKVANKDETLEKLDAQIKQLDKLIEAQKSIAEQTQGSGGANIRELDRLADKQFEVRTKTEALAKEIAAGDAPNNSSDPSDQSDPIRRPIRLISPIRPKILPTQLPNRANPNQANPSRANPNQANRNQANRNQANRNQANRNRAIPNRANPKRVNPKRVNSNNNSNLSPVKNRWSRLPRINVAPRKNSAVAKTRMPNDSRIRQSRKWKRPCLSCKRSNGELRHCHPRHLNKWLKSNAALATRRWTLPSKWSRPPKANSRPMNKTRISKASNRSRGSNKCRTLRIR